MVDVRDVLKQLPHQAWGQEPHFLAPDCYPAYVEIARRLAPKTILEVGAFQGYGLISFWLGAGPEVKRLDWVDNESYLERSNEACRENLIKACRLLGWPQPGMAWATEFARLPFYGAYDLIHVDGDHDFAPALADMVMAWARGPRAMLVDDFDFLPEVRRAVEEFSRIIGRPFEHVPSLRGWALFATANTSE